MLDRSRVIDSGNGASFPVKPGLMAWPYMPRSEFLNRVGSFQETRAEAEQLKARALEEWEGIKHVFFTASGRLRAKPSQTPYESETNARIAEARKRASELLDLAYRQEQAHKDPWSHTRLETLLRWFPGEYEGWSGPFQVMFAPPSE